MSFKKKFHRIISMFCVAVLLLPMVLQLKDMQVMGKSHCILWMEKR